MPRPKRYSATLSQFLFFGGRSSTFGSSFFTAGGGGFQSAIGNRINQLAAKANALNFVDTPMLYDEAKRWRDFRLDVSRSYLVPRKTSG